MLTLMQDALDPAPLMMDMALAMFDVTMAETDTGLRKSLRGVGKSTRALRRSLRDLTAVLRAVPAAVRRLKPEQMRSFLDKFLVTEAGVIDVRGKFASLLKSPRYRERLSAPNLPFDLGDFHTLDRELRNDVLPLLRGTRATLILEIARRANEAGVHVIEASEEFRKMFMAATLKESRGWQETAHLLADIEGAKRLQASIGSDSLDRTKAFDFATH